MTVLLALIPKWAGADLSGYLQARYFFLDGIKSGDHYLSDERLRPTFTESFQVWPELSLIATPQLLLKQGRNVVRAAEAEDYLTVERLYFDLDYKPVEIRVGRQDIHSGSGKFWNPTDVFRQTFLADYWAERQGINAAQITFRLPQELQLTVVASTGDTVLDQNRYAGRAAISRWDQTLSAVFMDDTVKDQLVYGFDFHGRSKIGYWVEAAWFFPKQIPLPHHGEIVAGLDYLAKVRSGAALAVQYFHDGSGVAQSQRYDRLLTLFGQRTNLAQDYATFSGLLNWNKALGLGLNLIYNLDDGTSYWIPSTNLTLPKGFQINFGANLFAGPRGGEFHLTRKEDLIEQTPPGTFGFIFDNPGQVLDGMASAIYYAWLRWNF